MQARLMSLEDLRPVPRTRAAGHCGCGGSEPATPRNGSRRGAGAGDFDQWKLREYVKALVSAYGYREDYRGKSAPWRVPYIPVPFAGEMVDYFQRRAAHWLKASVPVEAQQPNFIRNWTARASEIIGKVENGRVVAPNPESYEAAPAAVAAKTPNMFRTDLPAGQPHPQVLKPEAAWRFLDALVRLAIHFDALAGQPTKLDIFADAVKEQVAEVGQTLGEAVAHLTDGSRRALKWIAIAAVGLGALYVVSR